MQKTGKAQDDAMEMVYQDQALLTTIASPSLHSPSLLLFALIPWALLHPDGDSSTGP